MNTLKNKPEGWNNEITQLNFQNINSYIQTKETLQGIVNKCDDNYNLYVKFENGLMGIMPRQEVEAINIEESGLPKSNLCTGKVHKYVQFKIKEAKDENNIIISRKEVQKETLEWIKNELKEGQIITRNCKKYKTIWSIYRNWRRSCRISTY